MPDDRYSDESPPDRERYGDEPDRERRYDEDDRARYGERDIRRRDGPEIPNYLTQSILVTLFCCWPFGIAAIVSAAKVNTLVAQGDYQGAQDASDAAKKWCTVSFVLGLLAMGGWIALQIMAAAGGVR